MIKIIGLLAMSFFPITLFSQERAPVPILQQDALDKGASMTNRFQRLVKKLNRCPIISLAGTEEMFAPGAQIHISSLKDKKRDVSYDPDGYFRTVNGLVCGAHPVYKVMSFDYYKPVSPNSGMISAFTGPYVIEYKISQKFQGQRILDGGTYCDITIKKVRVFVYRNVTGEVDGRITSIDAEETYACDATASKN